MKKLLMLGLLCVVGCAADGAAEPSSEAAGAAGAPVVNVEAKQFVASKDVGVKAEPLTVPYNVINTENGAGIFRSPGTCNFAFRCWLMSLCVNGVCTNDDYTTGVFQGAGAAWPKGQAPSNSNAYRCLGCTAFGCSIFKPSGNLVGAFEWGSDSNYVFRTGFKTGMPYATCRYPNAAAKTNGRPTLTLSTNPL